ncbi:MAG: sulfotransferase [Erythrobacter sp.]
MNEGEATEPALKRQPHRYVFVAGLHRTGTSLTARIVGSHPAIATIEDADVPENEGCYLQGAIPHIARHGMPGHYATDPAQHLTEASAFNTLAVKERLEREWGAWFDPARPWRLEKSPVNLTRMRLLQALFPRAQFIVVTRHPLFMAEALRKWSDRPVAELAAYGVAAYRTMLADLDHLHAAMVVRYEDLVGAGRVHARAFEAFLNLDPGMEVPQLRAGNEDYDPARATGNDAGVVARLGYRANGAVEAFDPVIRHPLREWRNAVRQHL